MSVKVRINGREFTLSWSEFEKATARLTMKHAIEVLDIRAGGACA